MSLVSISTMWAQQDRFADMAAFRTLVASWGFTAIEVSHLTAEPGLLTLLRTPGEVPLSSLHLPTPLVRTASGVSNNDLNLASLDEDERRAAVASTITSIGYTAEAGLTRAVVHLGAVGQMEEMVRDRSGSMMPFERDLRALVESGNGDGAEAQRLRRDLGKWRRGLVDRHMEAARRSLRELVVAAAPCGIAIGLESRVHYHEIPHPREALDLASEYPAEQVGYWHDVGHCEVQARIGMIDRHDWFPLLTPRTIGAHLQDVDGIIDHRAPGNGDVDWGYIAAGLPPAALRVFEIDQGQPDDLVAASIAFLRARGVIE